jgi:hypothetical protein
MGLPSCRINENGTLMPRLDKPPAAQGAEAEEPSTSGQPRYGVGTYRQGYEVVITVALQYSLEIEDDEGVVFPPGCVKSRGVNFRK